MIQNAMMVSTSLICIPFNGYAIWIYYYMAANRDRLGYADRQFLQYEDLWVTALAALLIALLNRFLFMGLRPILSAVRTRKEGETKE